MRTAYFDCFSGLSGDMILGAMVDAGLPLNELKRGLSKLNLKGYRLKAEKVKRAGLMATKIDVIVRSKIKDQRSKRWKDTEKVIKTSLLSNDIKQRGLKIMRRLFEAEAKVHGEEFDLDELGALDCIIDIFGALIGLNLLGVRKIYSSPLNLGGGLAKTDHGILPVPAPATVEILKGIPVYSTGLPFELTTPTGAAILASICDGFMPIPPFKIERVGYGAGGQELKEQPNLLRLFLGEIGEGYEKDEVIMIETNIDDMNPQIYNHLIDRLLNEGAIDVYLTPVVMKKGRPGLLLSILSSKDKLGGVMEAVFRETTSFGLRFYTMQRDKLRREMKEIETIYGRVRVKIGMKGDEVFTINPEYEDCRKIAEKIGVPLKVVMDEAKKRVSERS